MKDRDFLIWLHARLTEVHGESPIVDYMHKLRAIIISTPEDKETPNAGGGNNLDQLFIILKDGGTLKCTECGKPIFGEKSRLCNICSWVELELDNVKMKERAII